MKIVENLKIDAKVNSKDGNFFCGFYLKFEENRVKINIKNGGNRNINNFWCEKTQTGVLELISVRVWYSDV